MGGAWSFEIPFIDPVRAFAPWVGRAGSVLLDSAGADQERGRHAFLAVLPRRTLIAREGLVVLDGQPVPGDPFSVLAQALAAWRSPPGAFPVPFGAGAVGVFGYELGHVLERAPVRHVGGQLTLAVGLYDVIAAFDRVAGRAWVCGLGAGARARGAALAQALAEAPPLGPVPEAPGIAMVPEMTRAAFCDKVRTIVGLIEAGEVYQINLTQRFLGSRPPGFDAFGLYRRLRALNPGPFGGFACFEPDLTVACASPERFLSLSAEGVLEARPIKGTRARGATAADDQAQAAALAASVKDRAENLMIADLLRNDIGRVACLGSVRVPSLNQVESHAGVHHLVSVVTGRIRPGLGPVDALRAAFPGGSITGAPKVQAMHWIDALEPAPRGAYCGALGWIGADGAMDTNIVIRSVCLTARHVIAQAGCGIVADSDPAAEYEEMRTKVAPALVALEGSDPWWPG